MDKPSKLSAKPLYVQLPFTVKTYDIDFAGIVHNLVYIRWLEDLRLQLLAESMPMERMLADSLSPILTRTDIEYRQPVHLGDKVQGHMWVQELGRTRWSVRGQITRGEAIAATARQYGYFADLETLRAVRVPQELRNLWEKAAGTAGSGDE